MNRFLENEKYPLSFIQSRVRQSSFHVVEGDKGIVTIDSVDITDSHRREVNLWSVVDLSSGADRIPAIKINKFPRMITSITYNEIKIFPLITVL